MSNAIAHPDPINIGQLAVGMDIGGLKIDQVVAQSTCIITYLAESRASELYYIEELYPIGMVKRGNNLADVLALPDQEDAFVRYLESFLAKARLLTQIESTGGVRCGESHNTAFLQREYEPGISLTKLLEDGEPLSEYDTRLILEGCGSLLREMQTHGLTHGDLQPCNVLIRPDKDATLLGICTPIPMLSKRVPKAAPYFHYTAIENIIANVPQARREGDIYSLGAVLHHCLTGAAPPTARSRFESLLSGQDDPLIPAQVQRRQTFNNSLYRLINTMLKPLRNERPHDVRDILNALQHEEEIDEISDTETMTKTGGGIFARYPAINRWVDGRTAVYALGGLWLLLSGALVAQMLGDEPAEALTTSDISNKPGEFKPPITDIPPKLTDRQQSQSGMAANAVALVQQGDGDRAGVFRELERIESLITPLFDKARVQLDENNLSAPQGNNALETYQKILDIDPGNRKAENGVDRIVDVLLGQAHDAFDQADIKTTENILAGVGAIDKHNREARRLRREIDTLQTRRLTEQKRKGEEQAELEKQALQEKQITGLLGRAAQAFAESRLLAPAADSALKNYRAVLKLDQENAAAEKGIERILDYFHEHSNQAIVDRRFGTAEALIAKARSIDGDNKTTAYLQSQLVASRQHKHISDAQPDAVKQQLE